MAGGRSSDGHIYISSDGHISSTELLPRTGSGWVTVNSLPRKLSALKGVTLGDVVFMTG